jgi:hypothetical protein
MDLSRMLLRAVVVAAAVVLATTAVALAAPTAPPTVLVAPAGKVSEKTLLTFRIQASAEDAQAGHWGLLIEAGNEEVVELKPSAGDPSVYERSFRLRNGRNYVPGIAPDTDSPKDFGAPDVPSRMFDGPVTWEVAFFPNDPPSRLGEDSTRTAERKFTFRRVFVDRTHVGKPRLPRIRSHLIVPGRSIAGVALGDSRARALKLWGSPFVSDEQFFDRYDTWARGTRKKGHAPRFKGDQGYIHFDQEIVSQVEIFKGRRSGGLGKLRTAKGIRLGSTSKQVQKAYPDVEPVEDEDSGRLSYWALDTHGVTTAFVLNKKRVVSSIQIG